MDINELLSVIKKFEIEAFSQHNDGWTQNGYRKILIELRDYLNGIENIEIHKETRDA